MLWTDDGGHTRRPIVVIEDHLYHTGELLNAVGRVAPERLADLAVCAIDRPGPDTTAAIADWSRRFPGVRLLTLDELPSRDLPSFARAIASLARPGGIVLQDIQLSSLPFVPADRWWESIYVGATVRGLFSERPPIVRFFSNKRGYDATFGKELIDAGFDPRDVMDKSSLDQEVVPAMLRLLNTQFPHRLTISTRRAGAVTLPAGHADRGDVERACDLVLWISGDRATLGGRLAGSSVVLKPGTAEVETWRALIGDRLAGGPGIQVLDVGARLGPSGAERAEHTNLAARHIHGLRARLSDAGAIVTANHAYRISDAVSVALLQPSDR
jgi:hypothetical protein